MQEDPFSCALMNAAELAPRMASEAANESDLLPAMLHEVRTFCASQVDGARIDREGRLAPELLAEIRRRGWFGLTVPERFGGAGLSLAAATCVVAELAAYNGSLGTCVGLHCGLALHALLHIGSEQARTRFLPGISSGERIASFAATEAGAGSDISAVRTTLSEHNGKLQLHGAKSYVTNGGLCGLLTVLARSPGLGGARAGHTLVLVDPAATGVSRGREENKLGLKGSSTLTITFESVEIPREHILGEPAKGLEYAHDALSWGRTFMAAGCLGSARAALEEVQAHTRQRAQFGRPLGRFQLVNESIVRARADVFIMESTLRLVCALADGEFGGTLVASTLLKVIASESSWRVVDRGLQLMGATGYMEDTGMARRLRDVRVTRIFEGANDVLRVSLASAALAWPVARLQELRFTPRRPDIFECEIEAWHSTVRSLASTIAKVRKTWGFRLFEQQATAADLADSIIFAFSALAVLARADAETDANVDLVRLALAVLLEQSRASMERAVAPGDRSLVECLMAVCD
jgi:alkylation response protein AidB-like acyl-CoA dehydrogenase